jgi:transcriptional regulator with XRE-family HTH domain
VTAIKEDLRGEMKRERLHPIKWGSPRGLTQEKLAVEADKIWRARTPTPPQANRKLVVSHVWVRQIESGYKDRASANTLGLLCYTLGVRVGWLRERGYDDIADIVAEWSKAKISPRNRTVTG